MRAAVERQRQLQDVLEIFRQHRVPAPVREAVGVQRDHHAAGDVEQTEGDPPGQERQQGRPFQRGRIGLRAGQRVDDAAEQDGFGELRRRERHIGEGEQPAQAGFRAEQAKHAAIETDEIHMMRQ